MSISLQHTPEQYDFCDNPIAFRLLSSSYLVNTGTKARQRIQLTGTTQAGDKILFEFLDYSLEFNNLLEQLKEIIQSQTKNFPLQNFIPKLGTQLTVSELALLFRLLDEEKIFNNRHKTDIYRFIVDSFESVKQKQISESSIKNKFLTPEISAIEKIKTLLTNLKIQLQRLENDISK